MEPKAPLTCGGEVPTVRSEFFTGFSSATLAIIRPGFFSTVQDLGRTGLRASGVGQSGAIDGWALRVVNTLIGNPPDAAAIEITLGHFSARFLADTVFAIGGADASARLDGTPLANWWVRTAHAGQTLSFGDVRHGMRSYLALAGGIDVPVVMGARATDLKGGFGGLDGRLLKAGDVLAAGQKAAPPVHTSGFGLATQRLNPYPELAADVPVLDFLPAASWPDYSDAAHRLLVSADWTVSRQSNRLGALLDGPELTPRRRREQHSHGILPGVIQIPPSGRPMVQLCDGNTCGGYPLIGTLIAPHLHVFGQLRPGAKLRLRRVELVDALHARDAQSARLAEISAIATLARVRTGLAEYRCLTG